MSTFASGIYKISSAVDSNVLDCEKGGGKKKCNVILWYYTGAENQKFQLHSEGEGFRITSIVRAKKGNNLLAIDASPEGQLILWDFHGDPNQQWRAVLANPGENAVLIKNVDSGKCLRSMGQGKPIALFDQSADDRSQWWNIIPV